MVGRGGKMLGRDREIVGMVSRMNCRGRRKLRRGGCMLGMGGGMLGQQAGQEYPNARHGRQHAR